jgi:hypothetical protein
LAEPCTPKSDVARIDLIVQIAIGRKTHARLAPGVPPNNVVSRIHLAVLVVIAGRRYQRIPKVGVHC